MILDHDLVIARKCCMWRARMLREVPGITEDAIRRELASGMTADRWALLSQGERDAVIACSRGWAA